MKFIEISNVPRFIIPMLAAVLLSGCAIGFNKNDFYCTEGPVNDESPASAQRVEVA